MPPPKVYWKMPSLTPSKKAVNENKAKSVKKTLCFKGRTPQTKKWQDAAQKSCRKGVQKRDIFHKKGPLPPQNPRNNPTAYIYVVESKLGPKMAFFGSKHGPSFLFFPFLFFKNNLLSAGRQKTKRKKKTKRILFFESKLGPTMLHNMLGPSFDWTLDQALTQPSWHFWAFFSPFQNMLKPLFL